MARQKGGDFLVFIVLSLVQHGIQLMGESVLSLQDYIESIAVVRSILEFVGCACQIINVEVVV